MRGERFKILANYVQYPSITICNYIYLYQCKKSVPFKKTLQNYELKN